VSTDPTQPGSVVGRQDLASAFGPTSRTSGLAGRLKRPSVDAAPQPGDPANTTPEPATEPQQTEDRPPATEPVGEQAATLRSRVRAKPATTAPAPATPSTRPKSANDNYPVHVPADLVPLFNERRDHEGTSNTLLVFDAIDALVDHDSPEPYARLRAAVSANVVGSGATSLFSREPRRARPTTDGPQARSQIMLRMSEDNRTVIMQLIAETGALDRSHLITVALTQFLTPPTTR